MAKKNETLVELHSLACRCGGASYMWQLDDRSCPCCPGEIPQDAVVLRLADWLFLRKPRTCEDSITDPNWRPEMAVDPSARSAGLDTAPTAI
jgi:hypothetical protein